MDAHETKKPDNQYEEMGCTASFTNWFLDIFNGRRIGIL
jgi:hypothetical protein